MQTVYTPEFCLGCPEKVVCRCLNITEQEIVSAITSQELTSLREVRGHTGAGEGCTCCHRVLKDYLERYSLAVVCVS